MSPPRSSTRDEHAAMACDVANHVAGLAAHCGGLAWSGDLDLTACRPRSSPARFPGFPDQASFTATSLRLVAFTATWLRLVGNAGWGLLMHPRLPARAS